MGGVVDLPRFSAFRGNMKAYLWKMHGERWERAFEKVVVHGKKTIRKIHQAFLDKRGHSKGGKMGGKFGKVG